MSQNKRFLILALAALGAAVPVFSEPARSLLAPVLPSAEAHPSLVNQDPLTWQIQHKLATQPDGGVTSFVGLPTGQSIKLESVELGAQPLNGSADTKKMQPGDPAAGLKTHAGLLPKEDRGTKNRRPAKKASEQLKVIEKQGSRQDWGEGRARKTRTSSSDSLL